MLCLVRAACVVLVDVGVGLRRIALEVVVGHVGGGLGGGVDGGCWGG